MIRPENVSTAVVRELSSGWTLASTTASECQHPSDLPVELEWTEAQVPGTVAAARGPEGLDGHPNYDEADWWYRCTLETTPDERDGRLFLMLDGLASIADVWLNGRELGRSNNMFTARGVEVTDTLGDSNELVIAFRSLEDALSERRRRPRWKTNLVDHQQLRWFRTTLLGRIPGWTPLIKPVGPWRPIRLARATDLAVESSTLRTQLDGTRGIVDVRTHLTGVADSIRPLSAMLEIDDERHPLGISQGDDGWVVDGQIAVENVRPWWPRTHGDPSLYSVRVVVSTAHGTVVIDEGRVGFRAVAINEADGRLEFMLNGVPIFVRGACWTTNDPISLGGSPDELRESLQLLANAHGNMVRVGGTGVYETDLFYALCDEIGLMVWQDFMFANMDYPLGDETFLTGVVDEARQQTERLSRHPAVVAFCGGSEVQQQAAMFGLEQERWTDPFFDVTLASIVSEAAPGLPYWPSTPTGGVMPFHTGTGLAHYYGVGAYLRSIDDARLSQVKFSPECLGLSHIPEPSCLQSLGGAANAPHHPDWKSGIPRDTGAGWDFEDVRDHYLETLCAVDAVRLRSEDPERYIQMSKLVTGYLIERVFDEWRSSEHPCSGGLIWFLRDLRPGAGWGLLSSANQPKAAYYFARRAWAPQRLAILDRGLDGFRIEVFNDGPTAMSGSVELEVWRAPTTVIARATRAIEVPARGSAATSVDEILGYFIDPTYAYRFGPPQHDAIRARFTSDDGKTVCESMFWRTPLRRLNRVAIRAAMDPSSAELVVGADGLIFAVSIESDGGRTEDNFFPMAGSERRLTCSQGSVSAPSEFVISTENASAVRVSVGEATVSEPGSAS